MTTYRVRSLKPEMSEWREMNAPTPSDAIQDFHIASDSIPSYRYPMTSETGGRYCALFMLAEVENSLTGVSKIFVHGITRKGGIKPTHPTLQDIAEAIGWRHDPQELIEQWEGEEPLT